SGIFDVVTAASVISILLSIAGCTVGLVVRFRRSEGQERLQMKWLAAAASFVALGYVTCMTINGLYYYSDGSQSPVWFDVMWEIALFSFVLIPIAVGIAILKYRLYEIDVIITKTVVFGALAAFITAVYVAVVAGVAAALGSGREPNLFLSILATVIVAVAFQPVRERVQRFANRLVYGRRATPYEVLTLFTRSLAALVSAEDVLPEIARHTAEGLDAQSVTVTMNLPQGTEEANYPVGGAPAGSHLEETVPVSYQGEALGAITVHKPASEPFRAPEHRLLEGLAAHAGVVLHNYRLTLELRARLKELSEQADKLKSSRERLVTAADTSRRAIERAIRERVERRLIGIAEDLSVAEVAMKNEPASATGKLEELAVRTNETLEELRDLARGIYPPLLADKGLVMALEAHIRKTGLEASLHVDPALEGVRFERSIETSCYFCIREALDNVALYARGAEALVTLEQSAGRVSFSVTDEGPGFDPSIVTGAAPGRGQGLQAMADRLAASGGELIVRSKPGQGTAVTGWVPLRDEAESDSRGEAAAAQDERVAAVQASSS
ncbi:MAG: GAF domain-containing sensor histidine kinase, partial [Actinomycetota bacterium]